MKKTLLRTDKNGTKYWGCTDKCFKCGGTGYIKQYDFYAGGVCFDCDGRGIVQWEEKEYTPEYEKKLTEQREKRAAKKLEQQKAQAAEKNAEFFKKNGFTADGKTYFVLGNTYDIKDELKAQGAKWDNASKHWHMAIKPEGREVIEIAVDEIYFADAAGIYAWNNYKSDWEYIKKIDAAESSRRAQQSPTDWVGEIGDKIELELAYIHTASWENAYGGWLNHESMTYIHTLKDTDGNVFVWKTGNIIDAAQGDRVLVKGTIKEHSEYKGIKQTVLTRCKVSNIEEA